MTALLDPVGNTTIWIYDDVARTVVMLDELENETTTQFDALGRIVAVIDQNNRRRVFTYNEDGTRASEVWQVWNDIGREACRAAGRGGGDAWSRCRSGRCSA